MDKINIMPAVLLNYNLHLRFVCRSNQGSPVTKVLTVCIIFAPITLELSGTMQEKTVYIKYHNYQALQ